MCGLGCSCGAFWVEVTTEITVKMVNSVTRETPYLHISLKPSYITFNYLGCSPLWSFLDRGYSHNDLRNVVDYPRIPILLFGILEAIKAYILMRWFLVDSYFVVGYGKNRTQKWFNESEAYASRYLSGYHFVQRSLKTLLWSPLYLLHDIFSKMSLFSLFLYCRFLVFCARERKRERSI